MVFSLVYVSEINPALQANAETQREALTVIENTSRKNNPALGVRGVLIYVAGYFIQWLEGQESAVRGLMNRIGKDSRHTHCQVVYEGNGPKKLNEWSMSLATRADKDNAIPLMIDLLRKGQLPEPDTGSVPADIFQGLLSPRDLSFTLFNQKHCQVALVGQTGLWSAAVITYLADLWKVPVQRTRLVGSEGFERESLLEYIDSVHPVLGPIRVMNFSGNVLQLPWIRSMLEKVNIHALFYSVNQLDAALEFTEYAVHQLRANNKSSAMMGLFGRTAQPLMVPVESWFKDKDMRVECVTMSLADVAIVWKTIETLTKITYVVPPPAPVLQNKAEASPLSIKVLPQVIEVKAATAPVFSALPKEVAKPLVVAPASMAPFKLSLPAVSKPPQLVSVKPTQTSSISAPPANLVMTDAAHHWLDSLLQVRGVHWAGLQLAGKAAQSGLAVHNFEKASQEDFQIQASHFKSRLAQESRLHHVLRSRLEAGEISRIVTRYGNAFEVSYGFSGINDTVVLLLQSNPGSADLAVVLSQMKKRLLESLPVFFQIKPVVKIA